MPGCQECLQLGSGVKGCVSLSLPLSHQQPLMPFHTNVVPHLQSVIHSEVHTSVNPSLNSAACVILISTKIPIVSSKICF